MLYVLNKISGKYEMKSVPFHDFSRYGALEKHLEDMLAEHMMDVVFEKCPLMPIFQERQQQPEADIYAINDKGEMFIFELKRGGAGEDAVLQAIRYMQSAGQWTYKDLDYRYKIYCENKKIAYQPLSVAHKAAFNLDEEVGKNVFNHTQTIMIVANAADDDLINAIELWKRNGLKIEFIPYRLYDINAGSLGGKAAIEKADNENLKHLCFFEIFAPPFDRHSNPANLKGVLFDTNASYDEDSIWSMIENRRISAYEKVKEVAGYLNPNDYIFYCHKGYGIVAAAKVKGSLKKEADEWYYNVDFLTNTPSRGQSIKAMSFADVKNSTGKSFFWARTAKVPYLSEREALELLADLRECL